MWLKYYLCVKIQFVATLKSLGGGRVFQGALGKLGEDTLGKEKYSESWTFLEKGSGHSSPPQHLLTKILATPLP